MKPAEEAYQATRPLELTYDERRVIIAIKLYQKANRTGPTWSWIRQATGLTRKQMPPLMWHLQRSRMIRFTPWKPNSTFARPLGVRTALEQHPSDG